MCNKVVDEEKDISHEEEENSEILDGDDDHAPIINIYELLMTSDFIKIQTDIDD